MYDFLLVFKLFLLFYLRPSYLLNVRRDEWRSLQVCHDLKVLIEVCQVRAMLFLNRLNDSIEVLAQEYFCIISILFILKNISVESVTNIVVFFGTFVLHISLISLNSLLFEISSTILTVIYWWLAGFGRGTKRLYLILDLRDILWHWVA